jgi:predicted amidohydrolase YtcJ
MVPVLRAKPNSENSEAWNIDESITFEESLTFYTKNTAFQMFRENERGSLEAGKVADFIVLRDLTIVDVIVSGVSQSSSASE